MNWLDVFCFTSVARTQSFSITAREMRISQQAVSRHIRRLEDELGFPLFLRKYQSVRLSLGGERMLRYFSERERLLDDFRARSDERSRSFVLRLGWSQWLGCPDWFRRCLMRFAEQERDLQLRLVDLDARELRRALERNELDALLTTRCAAAGLPVSWQRTELAEEPICLLGSRRRTYRTDAPELYPFIAANAVEEDEAAARARALRDCARLGFRPQQLVVCPDMGSACMNVLLKGGLCLGVNSSALEGTEIFSVTPTGQSASVVLCRPQSGGELPADRLERFLRQQREARA